jgi:dihydrolipoamide dehydrogenase
VGGKSHFDLAVVGAGPGGYVAAIRGAQLGLHVAVIESERPGGVCLNWGCIPTKSLLTGAELVESLRQRGAAFGINTGGITLDYGRAIDHSRRVADRLCQGVQALLKKNRIELVRGRAKLSGENSLEVSGPDARSIEATQILLATGSREWVPPDVAVDGKRILTSREALESRDVPGRLLIIGAGAVGIEFAYVYATYGARVTVLEMADQVLPGADAEVSRTLEKEYRRKGIEMLLGCRFEKIDTAPGGVRVAYSRDDRSEEIAVDQVLVAVGRRPATDALGLDHAGVALDENGFVSVDDRLRTSVPTISAIGDVAGGPLLAHKASEQGVAAVESIAGLDRPPLDPLRIPACIYAQPQVAWIGLSEAQAREQYGDAVRIGKFPFSAVGKAVAADHTSGFVKLVVGAEYGEILGAHVIGAGATELIAELSLAMQLEATTAEIAQTVHAHPTLSEAIWEAALSAEGRSLNR